MEKTSYSEKIARKALEMGAIRLSPQKPFCWASGYYMPIYNDNRTLLGDPSARKMIASAFSEMLSSISFDPDNHRIFIYFFIFDAFPVSCAYSCL